MKRITAFLLLFFLAYRADALVLKKDSAQTKKKTAGFYFNGQGNAIREIPLSRQQLMALWPDFNKQPYADDPVIQSIGAGLNGLIMDAGVTLNNGKLQTQIGISFTTTRKIGSQFQTSSTSQTNVSYWPYGGPQTYLDSVKVTTSTFNYFSHYLGLHVNEIYTIRISKCLGAVFGAGLRCMYSADPRFSVSNEHRIYTVESPFFYLQPLPSGGQTYTYSDRTIENARSSIVCMANVSAGMDLKLFTLRKSRHSLVLNTAINSGLDYFKIRGTGSAPRFYYGLSAGLKFLLG